MAAASSVLDRRQADAVVIGGGVIGLLAALELKDRGLDPVVLEADTVGSAQSGRNLGFVRQQGRVAGEAPLLERANEKWAKLAAEIGDGLRWTRGGHISLGRTHKAHREIADWQAVADAHDIKFELYSGRDVRQKFPWVSPVFTTAGFTPDDAHIDPASAMHALVQHARERGMCIHQGVRVTELDITGGRISGVRTTSGRIDTEQVICAAGVWSSRLLRRHGINLPLHAGVATVGLSRPLPRFTDSTVWEVGGLGLRQTSAGNVVFGLGAFVDIDVRWEDVMATLELMPVLVKNRKSMRVKVGSTLLSDLGRIITKRPLDPLRWGEYPPNAQDTAGGLAKLREMVPGLAEYAQLESSWTGLIDSSADFLPVVGSVGLPGLTVATGMSGHGMGIAPAISEAVAQMVVGQNPELEISSLAPQRLARFKSY